MIYIIWVYQEVYETVGHTFIQALQVTFGSPKKALVMDKHTFFVSDLLQVNKRCPTSWQWGPPVGRCKSLQTGRCYGLELQLIYFLQHIYLITKKLWKSFFNVLGAKTAIFYVFSYVDLGESSVRGVVCIWNSFNGFFNVWIFYLSVKIWSFLYFWTYQLELCELCNWSFVNRRYTDVFSSQ